LQEAEQDVSILGAAIGSPSYGLRILEDLISKRRTVTRVHVVEELAPRDPHDLVMVEMRREQIADVLPVLGAADRVGTVLFLHNHAGGSAS
jgi:hypothetical protein